MGDQQITITVISGGGILIILFLWAIWYELSGLRKIGEHMVKSTVRKLKKQKREDLFKAEREAEQERIEAAREARRRRAEKRK
jgi:hypothetical protein